MAYMAEKTLREQGDKVPDDLKGEVDVKVKAVRDALQGSDTEAVRRTMGELSDTMQKIGAAVYGQAGGPPPGTEGEGGPDAPSGGPEEGTVEGEYREV